MPAALPLPSGACRPQPLLPVRRRGRCHRRPAASASALASASAAAAAAELAPGEDLERWRAVALRAALAGAAVVRPALDLPRAGVEYKGAFDVVTDTDRASEAAVLAVLSREAPSHALLGEEGGVSGDASSPFLWAVDPLDGTTNFSHGYGSLAVSVALTRRGAPLAAAVVEFTGGPRAWGERVYTASLGGGALCNGSPLRVSPTAQLRRALLVTGFGYEHGDLWRANMRLFQRLTDETQGVRRLGAAAVDLCHVALGVVDGYWEFDLKPWDMAAGALVLTESGGTITRGDGSPFSSFTRSMVASNGGPLHGELVARVSAETAALPGSCGDWFVPEGYDAAR